MSLRALIILMIVSSFVVMLLNALPIITKIVHVRENAPTGYVIANAAELFNIRSGSSSFLLLAQKLVSLNSMRIKIGNQRQWMNLNKNSGVITLRHQVDRELCAHTKCLIRAQLFADNIKQLLNLHVFIDDVNDNSPIFPTSYVALSIAENAAIDDAINLDQYMAQDPDFEKNSNITYTVSSNDYFQVEQYSDETDTLHLRLRVIGKLDYEKETSQLLILTAQDGGIPPLSSKMHIQISITDVNDNNPTFEEMEYEINLRENLPPETVIAQVRASDKDSGISGLIKYSIPRRNENLARYLMDVNPQNGDITLKQKLDREMHDGLRILVEAHDSGLTNQRTGQTWLRIHVEDVNDNTPVITITYMETYHLNTVFISENTLPEDYFAFITTKDSDLGINGEVMLSIEEPEYASSANLETTSTDLSLHSNFNLTTDGFLHVKKQLDREEKDNYTIVIRACDKGFSSLCSSEVIHIVLLDVNDHSPEFDCPKKLFVMSEDLKVGSFLTTLRAVDKDATGKAGLIKDEHGTIVASSYGDITYHVINGDGTFAIEPDTGKVQLALPLDRELQDMYDIKVLVVDGGHPVARKNICMVKVTITDVNDNPPLFNNFFKDKLTIYATIVRDDVVARIQAVDDDSGDNGLIKYAIVEEEGRFLPPGGNGSLFLLNSDTGELRLNFSNPETKQSLGIHKLTIQASDQGTSPMKNNLTVEVIITDLITLPTISSTNFETASQPPQLVILISVLVSSMILLILIIVVIIMRSRNKRKKTRTYTCRKEPIVSDEIDKTSKSDPRIANIKNSSNDRIGSLNQAWSQKSKQRSDLIVCTSTSEDFKTSQNNLLTSLHLRTSKQSLILQSKQNKQTEHTTKHDIVEGENLVPLLKISPHDGDSGRGESDPDVASSEIIEGSGSSKFSSVPCSNNQLSATTNLPSRCTQQCLTYGHSDNCWMSLADQPSHFNQQVNSSSFYVELSPRHVRPHYSNNTEQISLQAVPETTFLHPYWSYPANDLSSIYSKVISDVTRQTDQYHKHVTPNEMPRNCLNQTLIKQSPNRLSPISSASSCCVSPKYPGFNENARNHCLYRRDIAPNEVISRSVTSLSSPNPHHYSGIGRSRSASAEHLIDQLRQMANSPNSDIQPPLLQRNNARAQHDNEINMPKNNESEKNIENIENLSTNY